MNTEKPQKSGHTASASTHLPSMKKAQASTKDLLRSVSLPDICTISDISEHVGIPPLQVLESLEKGEMPGRKIGKRWFIPRQGLLYWLEGDHPS